MFPDAQWNDPQHTLAVDRAVTQWRFTCTMPDGRQVDAIGCDLFHLGDSTVAVKSSFREQPAR